MLAHLKHLDLSPLLEDLDRLHVSLVDGLDGDLPTLLFVLSKLNNAELTLAQVVHQVVVVIDVELPDDLSDGLDPSRLRLLILEVQDSRLVWWQHNLHRIQVEASVRVHLRLRFLNESAGQAVHHSLVSITLLAVAEQVLTNDDCPVLLKAVSARLQEALPLETNLILELQLILTEIINNHVLNQGIIVLIQSDEGRARLRDGLVTHGLKVTFVGSDGWGLRIGWGHGGALACVDLGKAVSLEGGLALADTLDTTLHFFVLREG